MPLVGAVAACALAMQLDLFVSAYMMPRFASASWMRRLLQMVVHQPNAPGPYCRQAKGIVPALLRACATAAAQMPTTK
eukprot:4586839-Pleurochrysis_carterae.AAC.1